MPRTAIDYSKISIYHFVCKDHQITSTYVGSTTHFVNRKDSHKSSCNNPNKKGHHLKIYTFIRENGGWDNWTMIEIEKYPCKDNNEARAREQYWIEQQQNKLNSNNAVYNDKKYKKEYRQKNNQVVCNYHRERYNANKETVLERRKEIYESKTDEEKEQLRKKG